MSFFLGGGGSRVKPQFTGLAVQTSASSVPIGLWYGKNRGAGNIIWQGDFASHKAKSGGKSVGSILTFGIIPAQGSSGGSSKKGGGGYTFSGSYEIGLCWGEIHGITKVWKDQSKETSYAALGFSLFVGTNPQTPWGYLTTAHSSQALGYPDIAYLAVQNYDLGQSNTFPQHSFEVEALLWNTGVGGTSEDADPALVIKDFLSNETHGVGFDTSVISNMLSTVDAPTTGDSTFQTYCQAMGFAMSPFLSSQQKAGEIIQRWADLFNSAVVWTGYSLKFHPYGPDTVTANGVTYLPDFPVRYELTDYDYIYSSGSDPIVFNRTDPADAFNAFSIIIANRANEYNDLPVPWRDQGLVDQFGLKNEDSMDAKEITDAAIAEVMVTFMGQRKAYIRNTFDFTLPTNFCLLEPMDVLQCTDPRLGTFYVLIREVNEADDDSLEITAEEYPSSISTNTSTSSQAVSNTPINTAVSPGPVNPPIIFEPPSSLSISGPQIWAAVSGGDGTTYEPNWGGCYVWISTDNISFSQIGEITQASRQGKLTSILATYGGVNPDTAHTLKVSTLLSNAELEDASSSYDAQNGVTVCYVKSASGYEFMSYEDATLTGTDAYDLDTLWRGQYGTTIASHASGADFVRLDEAVFRYGLPEEYIGQTLHLKFQSYNIFGGAVEDISSVTSYGYTPTGGGYGTGTGGLPATPMGLSGSAGTTFSKLTWSINPMNDNVTGYQVWRATGSSQPFGSASQIATATGTEYVDAAVAGGQAYTYFLVAVNAIGSSANTSGVNLTPTASTSGAYRLQGGISRRPLASEEMFDIEMVGDESFPAAFAGSLASADVASTGTAVFNIQKNGSNVGTLTFTASATGVFAMASGLSFSSTDRFRLVAPSTQDATLSGVVYTLKGIRS
jgi:hypothetical protein